MIVYDMDTDLRHYVAKDDTFGVDTFCGKQIPSDRMLEVPDYYPNCDCQNCLFEIQKDLKRRPKKRPARKSRRKKESLNV
jgi:hypothetical protein